MRLSPRQYVKYLLYFTYCRKRSMVSDWDNDPTKWTDSQMATALDWAIRKIVKQFADDSWNEGVDL